MSANIGHIENSRSTRRVLKPPGGGHSDIFGISEPITTKPTEEGNGNNIDNKAKYYSQSSIILGTDEDDSNKNVKMTPRKPAAPLPGYEENEQPKTQKSNRVPPGGYSSGLW